MLLLWLWDIQMSVSNNKASLPNKSKAKINEVIKKYKHPWEYKGACSKQSLHIQWADTYTYSLSMSKTQNVTDQQCLWPYKRNAWRYFHISATNVYSVNGQVLSNHFHLTDISLGFLTFTGWGSQSSWPNPAFFQRSYQIKIQLPAPQQAYWGFTLPYFQVVRVKFN